jgi:hypothetical protein
MINLLFDTMKTPHPVLTTQLFVLSVSKWVYIATDNGYLFNERISL